MMASLLSYCPSSPGGIAAALVLGFFTAVTSPLGVVRLLVLLALRLPLAAARGVLSFLFPSLFWKSVQGEVVYVTGGAGGIGKLMSQKLARLGAHVVLLDKNVDMLAAAKKEVAAVAAKGVKVHSVEVDLADRQATYAAMEKASELAGPATMLINNAGIVTGKSLLEGSDDMQELTMAVNSTAHFWTVKACLPAMMEADHGHIVTIASSAGLCGTPGLADYCASKAAAFFFDESIRMEMRKQGKHGVKTTCVCPFFIKTGMFEGASSKWPRLLPLLEPEWAANKIISAVRCNQEVLVMPFAIHLAPICRAILPVSVCDATVEWFGVLDSMNDFKGRGAGGKAPYPVGSSVKTRSSPKVA
uniref:Short-chain dehydrogenase/reductase 3 n=2 Tax=Choreotrichia TaxID=141411 RepID=A0A7S3SQE3_9SPIT|mmetsp:Transcript_39135/g.53145  ORF Transcript_39135/g.53145 Transcript_39135/m.53145 type:complete len:359 (+) Transcript_39135:37-1113(+)